jgi:hypothetical protein
MVMIRTIHMTKLVGARHDGLVAVEGHDTILPRDTDNRGSDRPMPAQHDGNDACG